MPVELRYIESYIAFRIIVIFSAVQLFAVRTRTPIDFCSPDSRRRNCVMMCMIILAAVLLAACRIVHYYFFYANYLDVMPKPQEVPKQPRFLKNWYTFYLWSLVRDGSCFAYNFYLQNDTFLCNIIIIHYIFYAATL